MLSAEKGTLNEILPYKNLSPVQTDATLLANNSRNCWKLHYVCCVRLHTVACCYMLFRVVGSCCIRLHTTANTDATTPNIVVPLYSPVTLPNASVHECSWEKVE